MRKLRTAVLAGVAALGVASTATAANKDTHVMTVDLPDGSVARIEYQGDVAPKVRIGPAIGFTSVGFAEPFDLVPIATIDRVFADLDRQTAAMMRQVEMLQRQPRDPGSRPDLVAFGKMPARTVSYRFVSTSDGNHYCSQSWQWSAQGPGQQPKLISTRSGDCADGTAASKAKGILAPAKAATPVRHADPSTA